MILVPKPEMHLWRVNTWSSGTGIHSHAFSIFVSSRFQAMAHRSIIEYSAERLQGLVRRLALGGGLPTAPHERLLHFGDAGLHQIDCPVGSGTWLALSPADTREVGTIYSTHNVDSSKQQSFLMAAWVLWADFVECSGE
jgi:hypothetical protein